MNSAGKKARFHPGALMSALSCKSFLVVAAILSLLFLIVHLAGFREYTGILSGVSPYDETKECYGFAYIILYLSFVVIVPIIIIASVLTEISIRFLRRIANRQCTENI